jgi:hypothetical protein
MAEKTKTETFADRVNPKRFNFSPKLVAIVGAVIAHDFGVRDRKGGRLTSISITSDGFVIAGSTASDGGGAFLGTADEMKKNIDLWKSGLEADDRAEFEKLYKARVTDWRGVGVGRA